MSGQAWNFVAATYRSWSGAGKSQLPVALPAGVSEASLRRALEDRLSESYETARFVVELLASTGLEPGVELLAALSTYLCSERSERQGPLTEYFETAIGDRDLGQALLRRVASKELWRPDLLFLLRDYRLLQPEEYCRALSFIGKPTEKAAYIGSFLFPSRSAVPAEEVHAAKRLLQAGIERFLEQGWLAESDSEVAAGLLRELVRLASGLQGEEAYKAVLRDVALGLELQRELLPEAGRVLASGLLLWRGKASQVPWLPEASTSVLSDFQSGPLQGCVAPLLAAIRAGSFE